MTDIPENTRLPHYIATETPDPANKSRLPWEKEAPPIVERTIVFLTKAEAAERGAEPIEPPTR
jgi:hypothetical protein